MRGALFLLLLALSCPLTHWGQGSLKFSAPGLKGSATLSVFDGKSPRLFHARIQDGTCQFDNLGISAICYAEIAHPRLAKPIALFVEPSEITVDLRRDNPSLSRVSGSRSNSEYRYALESCQGDNKAPSLVQYARQHPDQYFVPFLLLDQFAILPYEDIVPLVDQLSGDALRAPQYALLREKIRLMASTLEGQRLPDFVFPDANGKSIHFDSVQKDSTYLILSFGATWCDKCKATNQELQNVIRHYSSQLDIRLIEISIDKDRLGWDNPMLLQLSIDYIPFLILVSPEGKTLARDLRSWELDRTLRQLLPPR